MAYVETELPEDMHWNENEEGGGSRKKRGPQKEQARERRPRRERQQMSSTLRWFVYGGVVGLVAVIAGAIVAWNAVSSLIGL